MDRWKSKGEKSQRGEKSERRRKELSRSEKRKSEKKEDAGARKGRKVAIYILCLWLRKVEKEARSSCGCGAMRSDK